MKENIYEGKGVDAFENTKFFQMMTLELGYTFQEGTALQEYMRWHARERCLITYSKGPHPGGIEVVVEVDGPDNEFQEVKKEILDKVKTFKDWYYWMDQ